MQTPVLLAGRTTDYNTNLQSEKKNKGKKYRKKEGKQNYSKTRDHPRGQKAAFDAGGRRPGKKAAHLDSTRPGNQTSSKKGKTRGENLNQRGFFGVFFSPVKKKKKKRKKGSGKKGVQKKRYERKKNTLS